jgi:MoxR-like ATPase
MSKEKYIPNESVTVEEKQIAERLEADTDKIYRTRVRLYSYYDRFKDYLPTLEDGNKAHWNELEEWVDSGELEKKLNLEELKKQLDPKRFQLKARSLLNSIKKAVSIYKELKVLGGDKPINSKLDKGPAGGFYRFRMEELGKARAELDEFRSKIEENREEYSLAGEDNFLNKEERSELRAELSDEYRELFDKNKEFINSNPEAFLAVAYDQIEEAKEIFDGNGTIVETPFVREKMSRIADLVNSHKPAFIHGELGSGKTEIAKHLIRSKLQNKYLARLWEAEHPKPEEMSDEKYEQDKEKALKEMPQREEILQIRGMRGLEKEDILSRTIIEREEIPPVGELIGLEKEAWERWEKEHADEYKADPKIREQHRSLFAERFKSSIKTTEVLSPIFQAMKEGRPVLIDEMNAIPHHVLIVLNDIVNRMPGDTVYTPTGESIIVQDGFCIIGTGNWKPEDGKMYVGRSPIDAAFLSRFGTVDYDFLPNSKLFGGEAGDPEIVREIRQGNEMFRMMVIRLLDSEKGANLPEGSVKKLKDLSSCARILQDVFSSGNGPQYREGGNQMNPSDILQENVLSLRHLIPIVEHWKRDGFTRSLDDYLFLDYVDRSKARPREMRYIYQVLQTNGFFSPSEGWPDSNSTVAEISKINSLSINRKIYGVDTFTGNEKPIPEKTVKMEYLGPKEVIEELFGPVPERKVFPSSVLRPEKEALSEEDIIAKAEMKKRLNRMKTLSGSIMKSHNNKRVKNAEAEGSIKKVIK